MTEECLYIKWGTLKGWGNLSPETTAILQQWADLGTTLSAAAQRDTPEQKELLCRAIDSVAASGGVIWNDWTGRKLTPRGAKRRIMARRDKG
jgi:hypothetical protein